MRRLVGTSLFLVAAVLSLFPAVAGAAATTWKISRSPGAMIVAVPTPVTVVFSDLGGPNGDDDLGCVWIDIPSSFLVVSATVTAEPTGTSWSASTTGNTSVVIQASNGGDRLDADSPNDSVTTVIVVSALATGQFDWPAHAHVDQHCDEDYPDQEDLKITVRPNLATAVPTAKPTPTATPAPTPKPTPIPTASPTPTPTPTRQPTPTPTPDSSDPPAATASPLVSQPPTPSDSATPSSPPVASASAAAGSIVGGTTPSPPAGPTGSGSVGPGAAIAMPGVDGGDLGDPPIQFQDGFALPFGSDFQWVVPGLVLTFPGLLIVLVVALQAVGALAWVPVVRRRLGAVDPAIGAPGRQMPGTSTGSPRRGA